MPKLTVDGIEVEVENGATLLQACEEAGAEIPRFCYHERLSIAGNCRMCLVEVEKSPKPVASCAMPAADGMVVHTKTEQVKRAREGVMEFLLINHPLDCPICDQGGECDLQDQSMAYGVDGSRFHENKRAVEEKYMGPLVKTVMTRCIHCTRCIRFSQEVAGVPELGAIGRGEDMEITTYLEHALTSELSANVVDLCPVGALTFRPFAYTARPWELRKTESIDVMDAVGSNIRVDARGAEVMRILPRLNDDVNEEWISDKTRFVWDGLKTQRLDTPYVRVNGRLQPATWDEAFAAIAARLKDVDGKRIAAIAGDLACAESMKALKDLYTSLGSPNIDCRQDGAKLDASSRGAYLFNTTIAGIEEADAILLVGTDPRKEAPIVNARILKRAKQGGLKVGVIGPRTDLTYEYEYIGAGPQSLKELGSFGDVLKNASRPMIVVGQGALSRKDGAAVLAEALSLARSIGAISGEWNGFNVLHTAAARVAGLDLGLVPGEGGRDVEGILEGASSGEIDLVHLLGADEIDMNRLGKAFVIYQGTHGDAGAHRADVILPGAAYTEKDATWVNTEGRVQLGRRAVFPPGSAREDWAILRALSGVLGKTLPYDDLAAVRAAMQADAPHFAVTDIVTPASEMPSLPGGALDAAPFETPVRDFFMTNPIARASAVMAECSAGRAAAARIQAAE
ncbi:NADH-quinone oxidoreductase subunit NuoG [Parvibaculum sp.]|jgi:NADH-quinone oxidoreductase subunit G|uniref:NADH-quinone oxidoreductase subunit NuoG n=1 Tax=Parvibaculum sp. TaxID=2024848 RepID=UPI000C58E937|nr:NADH-quinone oxidoreductase subunit NuoG [Parvibaculum sp.]MAU60656.1 NADH-quinone oxidoreductase subunit G [Parvibaculum sp.]MBO6667532.1 NADH-quinone oxidoreductase subunit G [Parvibaculum sp.]MBO6692601.1 NADH-quinone oxidoreductase subunit G [Parvibaculum sp.]MBO6714084.1 NADH-quinone oxidoreductase subunit G [Parvibaculum sp.]|tara:strand:- start:745 stop:2790 length:2046 start_codon:yes stop_codon:yes gene_type:complete